MKTFFKDTFNYHHHFNQKLIEELKKHEQALPKRTIPLFCHAINAHQIWNARIIGSKALGVHQVHSLEECKLIDIDNFQQTLHILEEHELNEMVFYTNSKNVEFQNSVQEILFHVANHFSHHKGQIISDFRQVGIPPLATDYIFYKR